MKVRCGRRLELWQHALQKGKKKQNKTKKTQQKNKQTKRKKLKLRNCLRQPDQSKDKAFG